MAVRLARILLDNGHHVMLGSRTPPRAEKLRRALDARRCAAGTYEEAASLSFVLPAVFLRDGLFELMEQLRPRLVDKTLIDIANPFNSDYTAFVLPWDTSASEEMQRRFPECRVVGTFKNVSWETFENPRFQEGVSDVYVVGDDAAAKRDVIALFTPSAFRLVDAGALVNARIVERMILFAMELGGRMGYLPRVGWKLLGEPWVPGAKDIWAKTLAAASG
jgi:predicted dinucleotide-binding enzyme